MYVKAGATITLVCFFVESRIGKPNLTVTVDVTEWRANSVARPATGEAATDLGGGLYGYRHTAQADCDVIAVFKTSDVGVDIQQIPAMGLDPAKEGSISTVQALLNERIDAKLSDIPGLVSVDVSAINGQEVADSVIVALYEDLATKDSIVMGQGRGSVKFDTAEEAFKAWRVVGTSKGIKGITVRAFPVEAAGINWSKLAARDVSDASGNYVLYLDPGDYVFSYERGTTQVGTDDVHVPTP